MRRLTLALALSSLTMSGQVLADQCPPLTILSSVDMKIGNSGRVFVPATINGTSQYMLVDTGGYFSELSQAAVGALQLTPRHTGLEMIGVSGTTTRLAVNASFTLGKLHANSMDFMVDTQDTRLQDDVPGAGGIIGPNLLTSYDVDFDFAAKKLNLLSQDHCDGKVIYWPADVVAVIPIQMADIYHIHLPVTLDGRRYTATLDTGASNTVLNLDTATRDFSLKPGDADTPKFGDLGRKGGPATYSHRFQSLTLEGITISHPLIELLPDLVSNFMEHPTDTVSNDTRLRDPRRETGLEDVILGMDILHRLHVYIAYKEKKLYITPAVAAKPAAAPATSLSAPTK